MNFIFILFIINDLLKLFIVSIVVNYYYNFGKIFDNPRKVAEIDIKNNIDFDKMI